MWQVKNRTPFAVERDWVRDRHGAEVWVVAVKATFDIKPDGSTEVSDDQPRVLRVPEYYGEPGKSSIKYETDLVLTKNTTDVIVVGHAYAPNGQPVTTLDVGFRVGPLQKLLRVLGDRRWGGFGPTAPEPFTKMPLVYERAFGGVDVKSAHPDGFAVDSAHLEAVPVPNVEWPDRLISSWKDRPAPAGFGAVASHWQPRVSFAGTYDERWAKTRQPLLPADFDERFFQCAPTDQQAPQFLTGGEPVVLLNLSPAGTLRFVLPKPYLGFETHFYDGTQVIHTTRKLHTVIIEPDFPRVSLVWHSALPCHAKVQKLRYTIFTLKTLVSSGELVSVTDHGDWP
jgi:hypothetical protein